LSVDYNTTVLTNRLQQVVNAIDAGATNGVMRLLNSGGTTLSSLSLARPCGVAAGGVLTFSGMSLIDPAAAADGAAARARVEDGDGNTIISGLTVGTVGSTSDIVMSPSNIITAGQTVAITAASITGN
jgi:hypothetical protein